MLNKPLCSRTELTRYANEASAGNVMRRVLGETPVTDFPNSPTVTYLATVWIANCPVFSPFMDSSLLRVGAQPVRLPGQGFGRAEGESPSTERVRHALGRSSRAMLVSMAAAQGTSGRAAR